MLFREPLVTCSSFLRLQDILANKPHNFEMIKRFLVVRLVKFAQRSVLGRLCTDVPPPSAKIGGGDVCESPTIIVFPFPRNVGDSL